MDKKNVQKRNVKNVLTDEKFCLDRKKLWCGFKRKLKNIDIIIFNFFCGKTLEIFYVAILSYMKATENNQPLFYCDLCDYKCSRKSCWTQHTLTTKHINATKGLHNIIKKYECEKCGTNFKHHSSYYRHKKKCSNAENACKNESIVLDKEMFIMLIKQNAQLIEQNTGLMDALKNNPTNQSNNTNSFNNNKTFNLQFFLNETCKDAMNIMDFIDSIKLQVSDLEKVGEIGYSDGISDIITSHLKALDVTQRPVHCTDKKRETMYIKDDNKWEKEDDNKTTLRKAIKTVANKNIKLLPAFREKYPDYSNSSLRISDKYDKIVLEAMGGAGNNDLEKEDKIIRNISKCVVIDK